MVCFFLKVKIFLFFFIKFLSENCPKMSKMKSKKLVIFFIKKNAFSRYKLIKSNHINLNKYTKVLKSTKNNFTSFTSFLYPN